MKGGWKLGMKDKFCCKSVLAQQFFCMYKTFVRSGIINSFTSQFFDELALSSLANFFGWNIRVQEKKGKARKLTKLINDTKAFAREVKQKIREVNNQMSNSIS